MDSVLKPRSLQCYHQSTRFLTKLAVCLFLAKLSICLVWLNIFLYIDIILKSDLRLKLVKFTNISNNKHKVFSGVESRELRLIFTK